MKDNINQCSSPESIWPKAGERYLRFLRKIEASNLPKTLAILGCSDGNYVLPAARRGFRILAIDADEIALEGGNLLLHGNNVKVVGLRRRLQTEGLDDHVEIVCGDCFSQSSKETYSGVFTSGSIHYQDNSHYSLQHIMDTIQSYVSPGGLLVLEYIHQSPENNNPTRHFVTTQEIAAHFPDITWQIASNKKKTYTEEPNPRSINTHQITWGRLYAQRR